MFDTQLLTSKRGPFAKVWLAAHWEKKLTKANVFECNLEKSIKDILSPKIEIGLRTSGHLLLGVVKIFSRKANYLLTDCNNALVKANMSFRPGTQGQTDLPEDELEASFTAITMVEGFNTFDDELQLCSHIDSADHFSLNQSLKDEITIKEEFKTTMLSTKDFGQEPQDHTNNLMDFSFHGFPPHGDQFGDEDRELDFLDFLTNSNDQPLLIDFLSAEPPSVNMEQDAPTYLQGPLRFPEVKSKKRERTESPISNQTTLLINEEEAFVLEPVTTTPTSSRKRGKRRRKLVVDSSKQLSNAVFAQQLKDWSDLVAPLELAPLTAQLMDWKENGGAEKLLSQPCSFIASPQLKEFFKHRVFEMRRHSRCEEVEVMRQDQKVERNASSSTNIFDFSSLTPEQSNTTESMALDCNNNTYDDSAQSPQDKPSLYDALPVAPSENSPFIHPSTINQDSQSISLHTQSLLKSEDLEERRADQQAQKLLTALKEQHTNGDSSFSLEDLCKGSVRSEAAKTFFCFLLLKKQRALELHQSAPYENVLASPGPAFYE